MQIVKVKANTGFLEIKSIRLCTKLENFLRQKPTNRVKVKIEGCVDGVWSGHNGIGQEFTFKPTKVQLGEF